MLTVGSLFSGIGGIELGLERAGMRTVWQVEKDEFCRKVLAKHWPDVGRHDDVRTFPPGSIDDWRCDVICGGFPCQDISSAGKRAGIDGERSGLWSEFSRIVRLLRPRYVLVENVAALLVRGIDRVLGDLAESGFDAGWDVIPASALGAPHIRERVFIVAYPNGFRGEPPGQDCPGEAGAAGTSFRGDSILANAHSQRCKEFDHSFASCPVFADRTACEGGIRDTDRILPDRIRQDAVGTNTDTDRSVWWAVEPDVDRVAHGIPNRVDRLRSLGNAVVPQCAEFVGRLIIQHHNGKL